MLFGRAGVLGLLLVALLLAGCGGGSYTVKKGVVVRGKIVKGGVPLSVPNSAVGVGWVEVELVPEAEAELSESQVAAIGSEPVWAKPDGSFEFTGRGAGVAPGAYRIAVYQRSQGPMTDDLQDAFSKAKTPIRFNIPEIIGDVHDLGTIDLDKPTGG